MKRPSSYRLICLCLLGWLGSCTIADLRTEAVLETLDRGSAERRGRELLATAIQAAGGQKRWQSFSSVEMRFEDEWQGFLGWLFRPWPGNPTKMRMRYRLGMGAVEGEVLNGPDQGSHWGVDDRGFWRTAPREARRYQRRKSARFIFRAYQYFFELPFEIAKADIILYAGERRRDKRTYDLVFATWSSDEPHGGDDQYLLWIARDSGLVEMAQYTIREKYDFATGVNRFSDFREVQGMRIPHRYWIAEDPGDTRFVHRVKLESIVFDR